MRINLYCQGSVLNSDCQVRKRATITITFSSAVVRARSFQPDETRIDQCAHPSVASTHRDASFFADLLDAPRAQVRAEYDLLRVFIGERLGNRLRSGLVCDYHCFTESQHSLVRHGLFGCYPVHIRDAVLRSSAGFGEVLSDNVFLRASKDFRESARSDFQDICEFLCVYSLWILIVT